MLLDHVPGVPTARTAAAATTLTVPSALTTTGLPFGNTPDAVAFSMPSAFVSDGMYESVMR